ncbi:hypothetical protein JW899_04615 [Candidatus Uhrbacteria bacterium]|nr:hypothetical protein [Candidatus Uhrbacteria bacterium]
MRTEKTTVMALSSVFGILILSGFGCNTSGIVSTGGNLTEKAANTPPG